MAISLAFMLVAASACGSSDSDDPGPGTGGSGAAGGSGGTGGDPGTGGTGGDPGTGGTGGDPGTGGTGGDPGTGGTGGGPGTGGTGGDPGEGGTGGDPGEGGTGGDPGEGGTGGDPGEGGTGGDPGEGGTGGDPGTGGTGGDIEPEPLVVRVEIDPDQLTVAELDHATLTATAFDSGDQALRSLPVVWRSSNLLVASVSAFGVVTGNGPGTARIIATIEGVEGEASVTVTAGVVAGVTVSGVPSRVMVGDMVSLGALVVDSLDRILPGRSVAWSSSDPTVATIDATSGLLTALAAGSTTITAEAGGVQGQALLEVTALIKNRVVMGEAHTCYLDDVGVAWCWGANYAGQLGDGTFTDSDVPTAVVGGHTFVSLAPGETNTCGITEAGEVWCWGADDNGQLGYLGDSETPILVAVGPFDFITSMSYSKCAIDAQGAPWCWGYNSSDHELGNASTTDSAVPMAVLPPPGETTPLELVDIRGGVYHACGLTADSRLFCWGYNYSGQLGIGNFNKITGPVEVFPGQTVEAFGVSASTACATTGGISYCWGDGGSGQLGNGSYTSRNNLPIPIQSNGIAFTDFAGGYEHMCALDGGGEAWCWGSNYYGEMGSTSDESPTPVSVSGAIVFTSISANGYHSCGVADTGSVFCWGNNEVGQLGVGLPDDEVYAPTEVQW